MKQLKRAITIIYHVFIVYAVVFSLVTTAALCFGVYAVIKPVRDVQKLAHHTPAASRYMQQLKTNNKKAADSLRHHVVPIDSISPLLRNAVIAAEDDGFFLHPGIDLYAILSALEYNRNRNSLRHGGSTITQQLAKNLYSTGKKTFSRKFKELGYAFLLEHFLTKERILELYLNFAQWGKNIFGCEAASQFYYGKSSSHLTLGEAARLAAILPKPAKMSPWSTKSIFMAQRLKVIADNLFRKRQIGAAAYTQLCGLPAPGVERKKAEADSLTNESSRENDETNGAAGAQSITERPVQETDPAQ